MMRCSPSYTFAAVKIGASVFPFSTPKDVSTAYRRTIDSLGLGCSGTPSCSLLDGSGRAIGYVSYNGKVWLGHNQNAVCVFNPCEVAA